MPPPGVARYDVDLPGMIAFRERLLPGISPAIAAAPPLVQISTSPSPAVTGRRPPGTGSCSTPRLIRGIRCGT
ncbi:hypothetical protein EV378_5865 [Pseudonocardia endophytica]|uniref:Uncharacterized protein n=1 Tax=Pseudonocardia endophytica TaxID=401976 RepID=A0A4R1HLH3_PSEEN|nr:hypothetical protein EV378_5865 [Pseudonocardia endophytica]